MSHEGWKNYETWCVALWLDNEYSLYQHFTWFAKCHSLSDTSREIKEWMEEGNPLSEVAGVYTDLLNAAISEVDYYEIAEHFQVKDDEDCESEEEDDDGGEEDE